jgi:fumarylacetoacetase
MTSINETHEPSLKSWVVSANLEFSDFPVQNLPYTVFRRQGTNEAFRPGVAIGNMIVNLHALAALKPFEDKAAQALNACTTDSLNALMALKPDALERPAFSVVTCAARGFCLTHTDRAAAGGASRR